jgi:hypothetical protein
MKLTEKMNKLIEGLNKSDLDDVREEVESSFEEDEMAEFKNFKEFFDAVDTMNAYEEEWKPKKWKPYYEEIYKEYKSGKLKFA